MDFEAANPTAHTLACLRFAGLVTETVARLATGSGELTLGRAGFAPAGRHTKFHGVIAPSNPLRPTAPVAPLLAACAQADAFADHAGAGLLLFARRLRLAARPKRGITSASSAPRPQVFGASRLR